MKPTSSSTLTTRPRRASRMTRQRAPTWAQPLPREARQNELELNHATNTKCNASMHLALRKLTSLTTLKVLPSGPDLVVDPFVASLDAAAAAMYLPASTCPCRCGWVAAQRHTQQRALLA